MAATVGRSTGHSPANITRFLKGVDFPAKKEDLVKTAQQNRAEREVIDEIQRMQPSQYENMTDVMKAYGKEVQQGQKQSTPSHQGKTSQQHK